LGRIQGIGKASIFSMTSVFYWNAVGDDKGKAAVVTPDGIAALMELWPVSAQWQLRQ
jgi:hypothetical protein